jgi:toxin ParE1/3/4
MSKLHLTPNAKSDLVDIALYTQNKWGKKQRYIYLKIIDDKLHDLSIYPTKGKIRPEIHYNLRSYQVKKHIIYYLVKSDKIVIVNILHERMDSNKHIKLV